MDSMLLKLSTDKTEFILFGGQTQLHKCTTESLNVNGDIIPVSEIIKYLDTYLGNQLKFDKHIINKYQIAMLNFIRIGNI